MTGAEWAAWVQAVGSILAILIAVAVAAWQRWASVRDARDQWKHDEREHARRLIAGLSEEVDAALQALARQAFTIRQTLSKIAEARRESHMIADGPIAPNSLTFTDGVIYREIAAELGRLPPQLVTDTVRFYSLVGEMSRIAYGAASAEVAFEILSGLIPRARLCGGMLALQMEKFRLAGFDPAADLRPTQQETLALAKSVDYPLGEHESGPGSTPFPAQAL